MATIQIEAYKYETKQAAEEDLHVLNEFEGLPKTNKNAKTKQPEPAKTKTETVARIETHNDIYFIRALPVINKYKEHLSGNKTTITKHVDTQIV